MLDFIPLLYIQNCSRGCLLHRDQAVAAKSVACLANCTTGTLVVRNLADILAILRIARGRKSVAKCADVHSGRGW